MTRKGYRRIDAYLARDPRKGFFTPTREDPMEDETVDQPLLEPIGCGDPL